MRGRAPQARGRGSVGRGFGQVDLRLLSRDLEKAVRHLEQDACAIARVNFRTSGPAMIKVTEDLQAVL